MSIEIGQLIIILNHNPCGLRHVCHVLTLM